MNDPQRTNPNATFSVTEWLDRACELAATFSDRFPDSDAAERSLDRAIIYFAAVFLWQSGAGAPSWEDLEVDPWLASIATVEGWETLHGAAAVTMQAFMCFLVEEGIVSEERSHRVACALVPYTRAAWQRVASGAMRA